MLSGGYKISFENNDLTVSYFFFFIKGGFIIKIVQIMKLALSNTFSDNT